MMVFLGGMRKKFLGWFGRFISFYKNIFDLKLCKGYVESYAICCDQFFSPFEKFKSFSKHQSFEN